MTRKALRGSAAMVLQTVATAGALFVLYHMLVRTVGVEQMGIWALVSAMAMIGRLADLGISNSVIRLVARELAHGRHDAAASYLESAVLMVVGASGGLLLLCYPAFSHVLSWFLVARHAAEVGTLLPVLLLATWLTIVATTVYAGLDAVQRYDLRGMVLIVNSGVQLAVAVLLVPRLGLVGLAWALTVQWSTTIALSWILVRRQITQVRIFPCRLQLKAARELVGYGLRIQATWIIVLMIDPITKALLGWFGSLEMIAYYDMASRLVLQFRQLTAASVQILTAMMAELSETAPQRIREVYIEAFRLTLIGAVLGYGALALCMSLVSDVWIGRLETQFLAFALTMICASFVNTLSCPAFFANIGLGRVRENTISLTVQALATVMFATGLGIWLGGAGVVFGAALAVGLGSVTLIVSFGGGHAIGVRELCFEGTGPLMLAAGIGMMTGFYFQHVHAPQHGVWVGCMISLGQFAAIVAPVAWFHPARRLLIGQFR